MSFWLWRYFLCSCVLTACVAVGLLSTTNVVGQSLPALACLIGPVLLLLARRRLQTIILSPVLIVTIALSLVGLCGFAFQDLMNDQGGGSVLITMNETDIRSTTLLFALSSGCVAIGGLSVILLRRRNRLSEVQRVSPDLTPGLLLWVQIGAVVPAAVMIVGLGQQLLVRPEHLAQLHGTSFTALSSKLALAAVGVCGYIASASGGARRAAAFFTAAIYMIVSFSLSSRGIAVMPLVFAIGVFARRTDIRGRAYLVFGFISAVLLLPIPLFLRGCTTHGLLPYLKFIKYFTYSGVDWVHTGQNVLISFPISGSSAFRSIDLPHSFLLVDLNPLPGSWVGWYDIVPYLTLNSYTPYSAVGELGNYGVISLVCVWIGFGAVMGYLDGRVASYIRQGPALVAVALVAMTGLMTVNMLQYPLRTVLRILLYTICLDMVVKFIVWWGVASRANGRMPVRREHILGG